LTKYNANQNNIITDKIQALCIHLSSRDSGILKTEVNIPVKKHRKQG